jgi:hypothetical protein
MPLPQEILESIPEEYRENETLNRFNDIGDLAKSYVELRNKQGRSITIPGKDAGEEDRKNFLESLINNAPELMRKPDFADSEQAEEFWRTLGKPDSVEKYPLPEDVDFPDEVVEKMRNFAYESNQTPDQFKTWVSKMYEDHKSTQDSLAGKSEEEIAALKQKWGMTFDDRVKAAEKINEQFFQRDFGSLTPKDIEALYEISSAMTGKAAPAANQEPNQSTGMTPGEARERIEEINRKVFDRNSNLDALEKKRLINKTIELRRKYLPEFQNAS